MTLNLIKTPDSGTSPAFGKGPSQSNSPPGAATLTGLGQGQHWAGTGISVCGYTNTFQYSHLCLAAAVALPGCGQWTHPCVIQHTAQFPGKQGLKRPFIWASVLKHEPVLLSLLDPLQHNHIFKQNSPQNQERWRTGLTVQNAAPEEAQENPGSLFSYSFSPREGWSHYKEFRHEGAYKEVSLLSRGVFRWLFIIMFILCDPWTESSVEKTWQSSSRH